MDLRWREKLASKLDDIKIYPLRRRMDGIRVTPVELRNLLGKATDAGKNDSIMSVDITEAIIKIMEEDNGTFTLKSFGKIFAMAQFSSTQNIFDLALDSKLQSRLLDAISEVKERDEFLKELVKLFGSFAETKGVPSSEFEDYVGREFEILLTHSKRHYRA